MSQSFAENMDRFFGSRMSASSSVTDSPARGRHRDSESGGEAPLSREQMSFVGAAVGKALTAFGTEVAVRCGRAEKAIEDNKREIAQLKQEVVALQSELEQIKSLENSHVIDKNVSGQSADATVIPREAPSSSAKRKRNHARNARRKRVKAQRTYDRESLLSCRKLFGSDSGKQVGMDDAVEGLTVEQRVSNLEVIIVGTNTCSNGGYDSIGWDPLYTAVPASVLARQCDAARLVQRAWKRRRDCLQTDILPESHQTSVGAIDPVEATEGLQEVNESYSPASSVSSWSGEALIGMSYLSVRDAVRLKCVSLSHGGFFSYLLDVHMAHHDQEHFDD